jgi:hypothetical protein
MQAQLSEGLHDLGMASEQAAQQTGGGIVQPTETNTWQLRPYFSIPLQ